MLGGAALMMTLAMGIRQNLGLFQAPASKELGIAISDFALAISVQQVAWGLSQPFAGIAGRQARHPLGRAGRQPDVHRRHRADRDRAQGALPIVLGAGVLIGVALACTTSGITANIAARVVAPHAPHTGLRHRLGRRLGRHHADRADRGLHAQPRRLARRPVGLRHPGPGHAAGRLASAAAPTSCPTAASADRELTLGGALDEARRHPRLRGDVAGLLRLRPAARLPHHPPADLSRPVRHGRRATAPLVADADRRLQHPELVAVRLAGRPLSQAPAAGRHLPAALGRAGAVLPVSRRRRSASCCSAPPWACCGWA